MKTGKQILILIILCFSTQFTFAQFRWNFNTDGNYDGWKKVIWDGWGKLDSSKCITAGVLGGHLVIDITCGDPYIYSPRNLNADASNINLFIKMQNLSASQIIQIYFITTSDTIWDEQKHIDIPVTPNESSFVEYKVDMSLNYLWAGIIRQFRFDPGDKVSSGSVSVDFIELTSSQFSAVHDLQSEYENDFKLYSSTTNQSINIESSLLKQENTFVIITDITGKQLEKIAANRRDVLNVNLNSFSKEVYFISIVNEHKTVTKKISLH